MKLSRAESGPAPWEVRLDMEIVNAQECPCTQNCSYRDECSVSGLMCERYLLYLHGGQSREASQVPSESAFREYPRVQKSVRR